jgi:hypothetical protein
MQVRGVEVTPEHKKGPKLTPDSGQTYISPHLVLGFQSNEPTPVEGSSPQKRQKKTDTACQKNGGKKSTNKDVSDFNDGLDTTNTSKKGKKSSSKSFTNSEEEEAKVNKPDVKKMVEEAKIDPAKQ